MSVIDFDNIRVYNEDVKSRQPFIFEKQCNYGMSFSSIFSCLQSFETSLQCSSLFLTYRKSDVRTESPIAMFDLNQRTSARSSHKLPIYKMLEFKIFWCNISRFVTILIKITFYVCAPTMFERLKHLNLFELLGFNKRLLTIIYLISY